MGSQFTSEVLIWLLVAVVIGHVGLILAAWAFHGRVNSQYFLLGVYAVLVPLSMAPGVPGTSLIKWIRVYVVVLMVVIGLLRFKFVWIGPASRWILAFTGFFVLAVLWSTSPVLGLLYKGLFGATVVAGVLLGYSAQNRDELIRSVRWLGIVGGVFSLIAGALLIMNPSAVIEQERMAVMGVRGNLIGVTILPLFIFGGFLALYDTSRCWRWLGLFVATSLLVTILFTGSRGTTLGAAAGGLLMAVPLIKRPIKTFFILLILGTIGCIIATTIEIPGLARIVELVAHPSKLWTAAETRLPIWESALSQIRQSPLLGQGWMHNEGAAIMSKGTASTYNLHNMYLQILAETGLLGSLWFATTLLFVGICGLKTFHVLRRHPTMSTLTYLPLAMLGAILLHGLGESAMLMGSTLYSLMFAYSVALIDRLPALAIQDSLIRAPGSRMVLVQSRFCSKPGLSGPEVAT